MLPELMNVGLSVVIVWTLVHLPSSDSAAPKTTGLPTTVNVGEKEYVTREVYPLKVTDVNNDNFICNIDTSTESTKDYFRVLRDPIDGDYGVYFYNHDPGTSGSPNILFNFSLNKTFAINIKCTDGNGEFSLSSLEVDIIQNDRLEFTNLPASVTKDALGTTTGTTIFTVQSSDLLNHSPLTYSMAVNPATTSFSLDSSSGAISTTRDLKHEIYTPIEFTVTVSDGISNVVKKLRLDLTNMNKIPVLRNVPASIDVLETLASGSVIQQLTAVDLDATDKLSYTMNVDPVTDSSLFTLVTTNDRAPQLQLSAGRTFNYEQATKVYNVTILVSDSKTSTGEYPILVNVLNDDEPCYFDKTTYTVQMFEAGVLGYSTNPNMIVRDHDGASTHTLSLQASADSAKFLMDSKTGEMNFQVNYDVDGGANPSTVNLIVICTDPTSLTGTATITVNIGDVNDNDPTFGLGAYLFTVNQNTVQGSLIATLPVTDADSGTNAQYTCSSQAANAAATKYYTVGTDCGVYLATTTGLSDGDIVTFLVTAVDKGTPTRTGTTYVSLKYSLVTTTTSTTTTTTVATTTVDPLTQPGTLAAIIIGAIGGAIILGLLIYFCMRYCYTGACCGPHGCDFMNCFRNRDGGCCGERTYPRREITPEQRTPPRKRRPRPEVREAPRDTAKEFNYMRDDSDFGLVKNPNVTENGSSHVRTFGQRSYADFPQADKVSDVPLDLVSSQNRRIIGYTPRPAIGYL